MHGQRVAFVNDIFHVLRFVAGHMHGSITDFQTSPVKRDDPSRMKLQAGVIAAGSRMCCFVARPLRKLGPNHANQTIKKFFFIRGNLIILLKLSYLFVNMSEV